MMRDRDSWELRKTPAADGGRYKGKFKNISDG